MYYVGIDIGGTNLKAGLVDEKYQLVATKKMPLHFVSMEQMGDTLAGMALDLLEENHISIPRGRQSEGSTADRRQPAAPRSHDASAKQGGGASRITSRQTDAAHIRALWR